MSVLGGPRFVVAAEPGCRADRAERNPPPPFRRVGCAHHLRGCQVLNLTSVRQTHRPLSSTPLVPHSWGTPQTPAASRCTVTERPCRGELHVRLRTPPNPRQEFLLPFSCHSRGACPRGNGERESRRPPPSRRVGLCPPLSQRSPFNSEQPSDCHCEPFSTLGKEKARQSPCPSGTPTLRLLRRFAPRNDTWPAFPPKKNGQPGRVWAGHPGLSSAISTLLARASCLAALSPPPQWGGWRPASSRH
jgi:hypothetical protein